jgi:hypothetical protein
MIIALLLLFTFDQSKSQDAVLPEYKVKSVFIFNFTKFVDWPSTSFESEDSPFIIGIIGNNPFGNYLEETVLGEKVGPHPIVIKRYLDKKDITKCHLLYLGYTDPNRIKDIISYLENKPVLTVSEADGFCNSGGMVQFYTERNKIKLAINSEASKSASLNISSKLLSVARTK